MTGALPFPDISPEIFSITLGGFEFALRWYALAYIVGILLGWRIALAAVARPALWRAETPPISRMQVEDFLTWIILGVILGGRLGFVLFYQPAYYLANPSEILFVWQGGMSFHGGLLRALRRDAALLPEDRRADPVHRRHAGHRHAPGLLLGRVANFINAELWGRPTDLPWGVVFPGDLAQSCGQPLGEICARHPSQLYEAALEGLLLGAVLLWLAFRRGGLRAPGLVTGVFVAGYGLARFIVEFFRQPDAQFVSFDNPLGLAFHVGGYGLTMGQILSLPMIALGLWLVLRARKIRQAARA